MFLRRHVAWWGVGLLAGVTAVVLTYAPLLRGLATFLVVEDPLRSAAAIVVLGGHLPFREMEAARLYRAGWASQVVLVRGAQREEHRALRALGISPARGWELRRKVLLRLGVPSSAILVPEERAEATLEELRVVARTLRHNGAPVILVTSKYHARRVRLTWEYVTEGKSEGIVRPAQGDPFDVGKWWKERRFALAVVREYLGLLNYWAGFPVPARAPEDSVAQ
ncbi:MAG: YdcF family protein [Anaerolineae bacterium]